jgi:hypothetical protein
MTHDNLVSTEFRTCYIVNREAAKAFVSRSTIQLFCPFYIPGNQKSNTSNTKIGYIHGKQCKNKEHVI